MTNSQDKEHAMKTDPMYRKGQSIFYKGDKAKVLDVKPVFTIIIQDKNKIMCGNVLLNDVCLK